MISLRRIIYYIDDATSEYEDIYMSIKDICRYFSDELLDDNIIYRRIASQIQGHRNLFIVKKIDNKTLWKLSSNGYRYLNKFKGYYDPINDKLTIQVKEN